MRAEEVERVWDVGTVWGVASLPGGSINGAFRVRAEAGDLHLRVYRTEDRARVEREHAAIALAVGAGIPTPRPLERRAGGTVGRLGEAFAALFPVAPGAPAPRGELTPAHAAALGALLADLHDRLPVSAPFEVPGLGVSSVERTVERLERVRAVILALPRPDEVDGWALERTRQRLAYLRTSPLPDCPPAFPARFLHGDYHDGNVFFEGERPIALIDWEGTRLAPRAWEVVRCLHLSLRLDPALGVPFLAAYRARLSLPAGELADGAALYVLMQERNVWTYESVYLEGNPGPKVFILPPPYVPLGQAWAESGLA
ncbi:phosphotransferase enzyme family protein [Deinococcus planocerae]|uniref:phosphotransferase enzyme family protein n=1 Tax=Deinococcus planocerae TaxID=1737569 RepID=UPI000C7EF203|nr:phosphotransferase [Deinococcus planocerae]